MSSICFATRWYFWRYRSHPTDCTSLTDGKLRDLCFEEDDEVLYKCDAEDGTCDTPSEWTLVSGGGGGASQLSDLSDVGTVSYTTGQYLRADGTDYDSSSIQDGDLPSSITRDSEWDTIGKIETVIGENIIISTEIDTEAELEGLLGDVTNVYTNNDGSLDDDDLSDNSINDLSDVDTTGVANGKVLKYNSTSSKWEAEDDNITSPAGSDGQLQYNDGGSFGGTSGLTWDDANNELTIPEGYLTTTPTGSADIKSLVNKEYVDLAVTSLGATYYMYDEDDATGYKTCYLDPSSDAETYIEKSNLTDDDYIGGWISAVGEAPAKLLKGVYNWYLTLEKPSGTKTLRVYWKLIERKSDDSETVIATSSNSNEIDTKANYLVPLQLDDDYIPDSGSRIVGKLYADVSGGGSIPTIRVYYQGNTSSRWEIPANSEIFKTIFVPYEGAVKDVNLGSYDLTTTGNVGIGTSSPSYKLDVNGNGYFNGDLFISDNVGIGTTSPSYSLDTDEIGNSSGDLKIQPNAEGDIVFCGEGTIGDDEDGKAVYVKRMANEGSGYGKLFLNSYNDFYIQASQSLKLEGGSDLLLQENAKGDVSFFQYTPSGVNRTISQTGWITAASDKKYIQWQLSDTDDYFHLTRQDSYIKGFKVEMPVEIVGSSALVRVRNPNNQDADVNLSWWNDGTHDWPRIRYGGSGEGATNGFLIQGPGDSTRLAILDNGNVGIGTSSPNYKLEVNGTIGSTNGGSIVVENPGTAPNGSLIELSSPLTNPGIIIKRGDGSGGVTRRWDIAVNSSNSLYIRDATGGEYPIKFYENNVYVEKLNKNAQTLTVSDNGAGGSSPSATLTPSTSFCKIDCQDSDGCNVTVSESGVADGAELTIVNISSNTVNISDSAGVTELAGNFAMGQYDSLSLIYVSDRWVEAGRSNN